jgi:hypothetical protein
LRLLLTSNAPGFALFANPLVTGISLRNVSASSSEIFLGWLRMEYRRNKGTAHDPWKDMPGHPRWILEGDGSTWYDGTLDPLRWKSINAPLWDLAEIAIDIHLFATLLDIPRLRQDAVDRLV